MKIKKMILCAYGAGAQVSKIHPEGHIEVEQE